MNATWYNLSMFHFLWMLPVLLLIFIYSAWKKKQSLAVFADAAMLKRLTANISPARRFWKKAFFLCGILFLILAMARPAWNPVPRDVKRQGRDVVFILDVSRSMLADDLKPSRLERARLAIDDCLDILEGDRVALMVFAGNAVVHCPLTQDYGFFRMMLSDIGCDSVSRGGTLIGDALRKAEKEVFDKQERQYKDIVLITDGEDHESFPLEAAKSIGKAGIRLIAVGLGNDTTGTPIVVTDENGRREILRYNGQPVRSRLDSQTLRQMVNATPGGRYLPVGTGNIDLGLIYRELIARAAKHEISSQTIQRYEEKFQIFLLAAMIFLGLSVILSDRRKKAAALLAVLTLSGILQAAPAELKEGNKSYRRGEYQKALDSYNHASEKYSESPYLHYNQGLAHYRLKQYSEAEQAFNKAQQYAREQQVTDKDFNARCRMGLAYSNFKQGQRQQDSNPGKALEAYEKSILELKSLRDEFPKAAGIGQNLRKIQLASRKLKNDLMKQMQKQQKAMQQAAEQSRKLDKLSKEQKQAGSQSAGAGQKQDGSDKTQQALSEQQQKLNQETSRLSRERQQQKQQNPDADKKIQDAMDRQKKASQALDKKNYPQAAREQKAAAEDLRQAKEAIDRDLKKQQQQAAAEKQAREQQEKQQEQAKQQQAKADKEQQQKQSGEKQAQAAQNKPDQAQEQPDKQEAFDLSETPQDILDEERRNQKERGLRRRMRQRPVDKNW